MVFNVFYYTLMTLFILVSLFLILLVLIQKGRGGGLASAFGGGGGNTAFGSKTGDVLTWATSVVFGVFLFLAIILNLMANTHASGGTTATTVTGGGTGTSQTTTDGLPAGSTQTDPLTGTPTAPPANLPTGLGGDPNIPAPVTRPIQP